VLLECNHYNVVRNFNISSLHQLFDKVNAQDILGFYRGMHFSAKRGIEIACGLSVCPSVCLSVCDVGGSGSHTLEILETNCTDK